MRVLVATPFFRPDISGSARLISDVAEHLVGRNHEVTVLTFPPPGGEAYGEFDRALSFDVHRGAASRSLRGVGSSWMLARLIALTNRGGHDCVLAGAAYPTAILAYVARRLTGTPYAIYSHGEDLTMTRGSRIRRAAMRRPLSGASIVMANSNFALREAVSLGSHPGRSCWVPPGIDPEPFAHVDTAVVDSLRDRYSLRGKRVVLTVARLEERKGHDTVVRALKSLKAAVPNAHYLVIGAGDPRALESIAMSEGVSDRLTVIPYVSEAELPAIYQLCDVHVMVSRWDPASRLVEGFGMVYLEAAASGKPSVAGSHGGCSDAVIHGETGLVVNPMSSADVAGALGALLTDPERAATMGRAGRERVRARFTRGQMLEDVETALEAISRRPAERTPQGV
jgi:phosphatidylinositol alpha-1,6-mannosyltransferase